MFNRRPLAFLMVAVFGFVTNMAFASLLDGIDFSEMSSDQKIVQSSYVVVQIELPDTGNEQSELSQLDQVLGGLKTLGLDMKVVDDLPSSNDLVRIKHIIPSVKMLEELSLSMTEYAKSSMKSSFDPKRDELFIRAEFDSTPSFLYLPSTIDLYAEGTVDGRKLFNPVSLLNTADIANQKKWFYPISDIVYPPTFDSGVVPSN